MAYIEELYLKEKKRDKNRLMDLGMFSSFWMVDMTNMHIDKYVRLRKGRLSESCEERVNTCVHMCTHTQYTYIRNCMYMHMYARI